MGVLGGPWEGSGTLLSTMGRVWMAKAHAKVRPSSVMRGPKITKNTLLSNIIQILRKYNVFDLRAPSRNHPEPPRNFRGPPKEPKRPSRMPWGPARLPKSSSGPPRARTNTNKNKYHIRKTKKSVEEHGKHRRR